MARLQKGLNRHQKAAFRPGEHRVRSKEIERLLELAHSSDPEERLEAISNLCPCHVRRRLDEVWQAIYQMMEDPDVRVRRAAWHTLEDGGCPSDPALAPIFARAARNETDTQVLRFVEMFALPYLRQKETEALLRAAHSPFQERDRCDFCGRSQIPVRQDFETEIQGVQGPSRFARICKDCDRGNR
jgi:hypothetical protein